MFLVAQLARNLTVGYRFVDREANPELRENPDFNAMDFRLRRNRSRTARSLLLLSYHARTASVSKDNAPNAPNAAAATAIPFTFDIKDLVQRTLNNPTLFNN